VVRLRLKRFGRRNHPYYRVCAIDQRAARDGEPIELLGTYDPINKNEDQQIQLDADRVKYWIGVGAQPTETVHGLIKRSGILEA